MTRSILRPRQLGIAVWWLFLAGCPPKHPVTTTPLPGEGETAPGSVQVDVSVPVQDRVAEAAALIESGAPEDLRRAIALLESAMGDDRSGLVRYDLGLAYHLLGDLRQAQNQYQSAISMDPSNGDAWLALGKIHEQEGDFRAAMSTYESGVGNAPDHTDLHVAYINGLRRDGRVDESIAAAKESLGSNSKSLPLYNALGLAHLEKNNLVLARFVFDKALQEIDGAESNAVLQANLGRTFYLSDNKPQATEHLLRALEIDPDLVIAMVYLARVYMDDHNYVDTVPLLERAAALDPGNADIQLTLGVAYRGMERFPDADAAYRKALALDPADPSPHLNIGVLKGDYLKDYAGAVAEFNAYLEAGGVERALAEGYIGDIEREKALAEKREKAAAERKARAAERKRKEELAAQPDPAPGDPAPEDPEGAPPEGDAPEEGASEGAAPEEGAPEGGASEGAAPEGDTPKEGSPEGEEP